MRLAAALISLAIWAISHITPAQANIYDTERAFVKRINAERNSRGLSTLKRSIFLSNVARHHSARMARVGDIWHNNNLRNEVGSLRDSYLGENVGMGPSVDSLHTAFMRSKHHRENILEPVYSQIGIGVVIDGEMIYVTELFAHRVIPFYKARLRKLYAQPKSRMVKILIRILELDSVRHEPRKKVRCLACD